MSKQPPPAIGPCPTFIQIVGRPGTGSLHRTIARYYFALKFAIYGKGVTYLRYDKINKSKNTMYSRWAPLVDREPEKKTLYFVERFVIFKNIFPLLFISMTQ